MARESGDGSWSKLLIEIYTKYTSSIAKANNGINSSPLSLLHTGYYNYRDGTRNYREFNGGYWESSVYGIANTNLLYYRSSFFDPQYKYGKGYGFSLRCVTKSPLLFIKQARSFSPTLFCKIQSFSSRLCIFLSAIDYFSIFLYAGDCVAPDRRQFLGTSRRLLPPLSRSVNEESLLSSEQTQKMSRRKAPSMKRRSPVKTGRANAVSQGLLPVGAMSAILARHEGNNEKEFLNIKNYSSRKTY